MVLENHKACFWKVPVLFIRIGIFDTHVEYIKVYILVKKKTLFANVVPFLSEQTVD